VEHLDLTQRFMEYKAGESARVRLHSVGFSLCFALFRFRFYPLEHCGGFMLMRHPRHQLNEIQKLHEEVTVAKAGAAAAAAAAVASAAAAAGGAPLGPPTPDGGAAAAAAQRPLPRAARHTLRAAACATHALAYSPNGAQLATAGEDKSINVRACARACVRACPSNRSSLTLRLHFSYL